MWLGLRLSLLLLIAGCAEPALVVPDSDWRTVPEAQRASLDQRYEADLAAARAELAAATASLAALEHAPAPPRGTPSTPGGPSAAKPQDPWAAAAHDHEKARTDALGRVEAAMAEVQRTDAARRRLRVEAAGARVDLVVSQRELFRAQAIDRNLPGGDTYDVAPLRGQFSRVQQRWYKASTAALDTRDAFERASTSLASAKEEYAQLMRGGSPRLPGVAAADDHTAKLELAGWAVTRSDIRRRRGLRHFLDDAGTTPQLRKVAIQLSPAIRAATATAKLAAPGESPGTPASAKPPAPASRESQPAPANVAAPASLPSPASAKAIAPASAPHESAPAKPAASVPAPRESPPPPPPANLAAPAPRPAPAKMAAPAPAIEHPADRAGNPAPPPAASSIRPAPVPRAAPPATQAPVTALDHPADRAGNPAAHARPGDARPAPSTVSKTERSASPQTASNAPAGKPADHTAAPPTATAAAAPDSRPADPARAQAAAAAPRPPTPSAAKPVERPAPDPDAHAR